MKIETTCREKDGWWVLTLTRDVPLPLDRRCGIWMECWLMLVCCDFDLTDATETKTDKCWKFIDERRFKLYLDSTRLAVALQDLRYLNRYKEPLAYLFGRAEKLGKRPGP